MSATTVIHSPTDQERDLLESISLYIHIPFCHAKCHYCDFNSYAGLLGWRSRYVRALVREITLVGEAARRPDGQPRRCRTIFFGGGTPSLLRPAEVEEILAAARASFAVDDDAEITLEANPGTLERLNLAEVRATGLTRISMGAQSFDAGLLKWMGRIHSPEEIVSAVQAARAAGFDNLNLDFIFALPDQTMAQWRDTLERAVTLAPNHLSLYSLIVEPETPLFDWVAHGAVTPADDDLAADMYRAAQEIVAAAGYQQYEISNWAKPGHECQHNLTYWHNLPYIGVGAGAHSYFDGRRFANVRPVEGYVAALSGDWQPHTGAVGIIGGPVAESTQVSPDEDMAETAILALRLNEGLDIDSFERRFGTDFDGLYGKRIVDLIAWKILEQINIQGTRRLRLTEQGRLVGNEAFERFLPESV
ncbi:MAG TPA: radical SAM family heme chaperone HemW [Ktedonobacterales bacterium]|nr:radical SAM family heme chaperone HemW [Ktedonobacterales bacterium]